ncbi:Condensin complex subunit 2 [Mycena kentingensis (nom. inval.)]|nr:Condensin complex subunit 2 [Mycena kentingensis (nom. inval.)]
MPRFTTPDSDDDQPTPRPQRVRKRISDAHQVSFGDSPPRPDRSTANDDNAEKRRRRKSTKIAIIDQPNDDHPEQAETFRTARQKQPLNSVAAPVVGPSIEILTSNYDEWMKMATDNKITAGNSWNFALIDYFHDMSLLRNEDGSTINFQRASCTLDGCVKIWTSRVDSVGTDTTKLLSNLANDGKDDEDEDGNESDNADGEGTTQKKKKSHRPAATLAKDPAQLRSKKLDVEFSVDPLFKKTSADFDEGGAQGLLMNHLSLGTGKHACLRVIFDASDSAAGQVEGEDEDDKNEEPLEFVDLTELRKEFLPDLDVLDDKEISQSLADFSFSGDNAAAAEVPLFEENTQYFDQPVDDDEDDAQPAQFNMDVDQAPVEDFFAGDDGPNDDFGDMMGGDDFGVDHVSNGSGLSAEQGGHAGPGGMMPFDPRRPANELVMAMVDGDGDNGMMDQFDRNFSKNWAGPEHWKMRRVVLRKPEGAEVKQQKPRREKKEPFKIDFSAPRDKQLKQLTDELFAPAGKGAGINLPGMGPSARKTKSKKAKGKEKDDHMLPDDMHFSSRQLVSLFLKPKFRLKMRGRNVKYSDEGNGEIDAQFWAQAAADQGPGNDDDDNGGSMPFNTQFFDDAYDDGPGFDDGFDDPVAPQRDPDQEEEELLAATQGKTRRVRPEFVNYAKRAKRVDVRKLKENIWKGLDIVIAQKKEEEDEEEMDVDTAPDQPPPTDPSEARVFSSVIDGLQKSYPKDRMEEISTSFCFICLLHLANEQGLKLDAGTGEIPVAITDTDKKIGNIWDLKIYRDPNATQSA